MMTSSDLTSATTTNLSLELSNSELYYHYGKQPSEPFEKEKYFFMNRLLLFMTNYFLPLSNGNVQFKDDPASPILTSFINFSWPTSLLNEIDSSECMNSAHSIYHKIPFFISNPSLRILHISDDSCHQSSLFKLGFRISQTYTEAGLPLEIKCATCHPTIPGLPMFYYLFPERDFTQDFHNLQIASRHENHLLNYCEMNDCEQSPRVASFLSIFIHLANKLTNQKVVLSQYISRWSGEQATNEKHRNIQGIPDGRIWINAPWSKYYKNPRMEYEVVGIQGLTTMCAMELNENMVGSNLYVNTDSIGKTTNIQNSEIRTSQIFSYDHYETIKIEKPSIKKNDSNLEIFISWKNWSCCSACCCTSAICGNEYQTSTNCDNVYSFKTRIGYLSIRKIWPDRSITASAFSYSLDRTLSLPPYSRDGVPIYSTLLDSSKFDDIFKFIEDEMIQEFLTENQQTKYQMSSGIFVESKTCKSDAQKIDCNQWAKCHGIEIGTSSDEKENDFTDSCSQLQFIDILVGKFSKKITSQLKENLRIRIDPEVHDMNTFKSEWRVDMRKPKKYDKEKRCENQGVISKNNEILIIGLKSFKLKVDLIINSTQRIRISFSNKEKSRNYSVIYWSVLYWSLAIIIFIALLIHFVIFMRKEKTKRIENIIKIKSSNPSSVKIEEEASINAPPSIKV